MELMWTAGADLGQQHLHGAQMPLKTDIKSCDTLLFYLSSHVKNLRSQKLFYDLRFYGVSKDVLNKL